LTTIRLLKALSRIVFATIASALLVTAFATCTVTDYIQDFSANDTLGYYSQQPLRLLLVGAIGVAGGLAAHGFYRLPSPWQRRVKLLALGAAAATLTLVGGSIFFELRQIHFAGSSIFWPFGAAALLLWIEFYRVWRVSNKA